MKMQWQKNITLAAVFPNNPPGVAVVAAGWLPNNPSEVAGFAAPPKIFPVAGAAAAVLDPKRLPVAV